MKKQEGRFQKETDVVCSALEPQFRFCQSLVLPAGSAVVGRFEEVC